MNKNKKLKKQDAMQILAASNDFDETHYTQVGFQQLMMLRKAAAATLAKQSADKNADQTLIPFFRKRVDFFTFLIIKRLPEIEMLWFVYTKQTNLPFLTYDERIDKNLIYIYTEEKIAKEVLAKSPQMKSYPYEIQKVEKKDFINFYMTLHALGVDIVVIDPSLGSFAFELEKFIKKPDFSKTIINQPLFINGIYFSQEQRNGSAFVNSARVNKLWEKIQDNLVNGEVFLGGIAPEGIEKPAIADLKYPVVQDNDGNKYQLVFTDRNEMLKYVNKVNQKLIPVPIKGEAFIQANNKNSEEIIGLIINPASIALPFLFKKN